MSLNSNSFRVIFTVFVFTALASLDNAVVGLFPPLFSLIAKDLNIHVSQMGIVSAVNIFVTAASSIVWGYLADRGNRRRLIIIGTIIWSVSVFLTAYSQSYLQLIIYQLLTGIGLGCIASIGFSVLTDYIPNKWRGMLLSFWGLSQGFGGIAGSIIAPIIAASSNWRKPFELIALLGLVFTVFYFFIKEPQKGATEHELKDLIKEGHNYEYTIELSQIYKIITKKSNKWLIIQGFFMNLTTGTFIWLPTLYIAKIVAEGYSSTTAVIASGFLYAIMQTGGLFSIYFGYLGDRLQKHTYRARALLAALFLLIAIPLFVLMFITPMNNLAIPDNGNPLMILLGLLKQMVTNPWIMLMFFLALGATTAQSSNTPNWLAILTEVNLPEHRATAFSIGNLVQGIGRAVGNAMIGVVLIFMSAFKGPPHNYIYTLILFQIFFIPAIYSYIRLSRNSGRDIRKVKSVLKRRAKKHLS